MIITAQEVSFKEKEDDEYQIRREEDKTPSAEIIATYAESLRIYLKDSPKIDPKLARHIKALPTPKKIRRDLSNEECKILFETIGYLWKKITGKDIIQEMDKISPPETLAGNYWMLSNGVLLSGINHYTIIKKNAGLIASLLKLNQFALQEHLSRDPNELMKFVIKNGGVRLFINKNKRLFCQMTPDTYSKWGRGKIKKYDFKSKTVRVVDLKTSYNGWSAGIPVKL